MRDTLFYQSLSQKVDDFGGYHNAHLHLDRAYTDTTNDSASDHSGHLGLKEKHQLISSIHGSEFYEPVNLSNRLRHCLTNMAQHQTRRADSVIDVTDDGLGLRALETARRVSDDLSDTIDFRIAAYSPLGFRADSQAAWNLMERGAEIADFIGCLPERDDTADYPGHIGYEETCGRMIELTHQHDTFLHIHTDQMNSASECGTERILDVLENHNPFQGAEPRVWAIHMISPSAYDNGRWAELVDRMKTVNMGVICCPSAALGMRQLRHEMAPTHNSIARVLELCEAGVHVRLGNDNCADMLSPSTTTDLTDEVFVLSAAIRFYDVDILAQLACGHPLNDAQRAVVRDHLDRQHA